MKTTVFRIYMGLNDKDTKKQEVSTGEAYTIFNGLVLRNFDGATVWSAKGVYTHEDGTQVSENTLCCELIFANFIHVKRFVETLKDVFNQESVAVQHYEVESELW